MFKFKHYLFLLILLFFGNATTFAKQRILSKKEITALAKVAVQDMKEARYEKSLIAIRSALRSAIAIKDNNLIAICYNTIAANFDGLSETDKAFSFYHIGLTYANKTNNNELKNWLYNNLGNIYCFDKKQYKTGISYYKKSLEYSHKTNDSIQILLTKLNITWSYFDINQFENGLPYLKYINKYHNKHGDESTLVALNMLNGMYFANSNETEKANIFFKKAIQFGKAGIEKSDLSYSYQEYSKFLFKNKDYEKAYQNLDLYNKITTEINDEEKLDKANVAGINLELDEYKREIERIENKYQTRESALLEDQIKNKKIILTVILLFVISTILFYFFYQNYRLKQKNRLNSIRSKIQQNVINASVNGQELERKKIATFLHDNISALLSSAGMHLNAFTSQNPIESQEITKTKSILAEAHDKVRDLSHELTPVLLTRFGLFYALHDLCEKNSNAIVEFEYWSEISDITRYDEEFELKMYFIITELFNNIIKHSQASKAKITFKKEAKNNLKIEISDNGKGFDTREFHFTEGFGLNQIRARIYNMKGTITVDSKKHLGTTTILQVPVIVIK
jgi:two-component system, NarL family, sensor kinase